MATSAPQRTGVLLPDQELLRTFWRALVWPGEVHEVRIPQTRGGPARLYGTASGYFDDAEPFVRALAPISGRDAAGVYVTMNPVKTTLLARARNRLESRARATSSDADVTRRRHLLIDLDPVRDPKDVSATEEEVQRALLRRDGLWHWLGELGWPAPAMVVETGNGGALLYRVALANDEAAADLVRRVLGALDAQFSDSSVKVDVVNYNAARICKVVGTVAAKGEDFGGCAGEPARRWRLARATYSPEPGAVSKDLLCALATEAPRPQTPGSGAFGPERTWTMDDLLRANSLRAHGQSWASGGTKYRLERCLCSPDHTDGAVLIEMPSGAIVYRCHHDRCSGKGWAYLKEHGLIRLPGQAHERAHNGRRDPLVGPAAAAAEASAAQGAAASVQRLAPHDEVPDEDEAGPLYVARRFAQIEEGFWDWAWGQRMAYGMVAVIGGDGGAGKTWTLVDVACRLSTGTPLPGEPREPRREPATVVMLNHEDDAERELKGRVRTLAGDQERLVLWESVKREGQEDFPDLTRDLLVAEQLLGDYSARVLMIDPLTGYLGKTKTSDESEVRRALMPLTRMARRLNVAILGVMHPRKGEDIKALNMLLGSVAFKNVARSVMLIGKDPHDEGRRVLLHEKSNNRSPAPGLGFRIDDDGPHWDDAPVTCTGEDIWAPHIAEAKAEQGTQLDQACELLSSQLAAGRQPAEALYTEAEKGHGIKRTTLWRAKRKLGVKDEREGFGSGSAVYWRLPS